MRKIVVATLILVALIVAGCGGSAEKTSPLLPGGGEFETGTTEGWDVVNNCTTVNDPTQAVSATKSLKMTATAAGDAACGRNVNDITSAGSSYTTLLKFRGYVGKKYSVNMYGNVSGNKYGSPVTASGKWQHATDTKTFAAGDTQRMISFVEWNASAGDTTNIDAVQILEGTPKLPPEWR